MEASTSNPRKKKPQNVALIELVRLHPIIYDPKCENYGKIGHIRAIWDKIAKITKLSVTYCMAEWTGLRQEYTKHLARKLPICRAFPYSQHMSFLWPFYQKLFAADCSAMQTSSNEFSEKDETFLIAQVKQIPALYDGRSLVVHAVKHWEDISDVLNISVKSCFQKWLYLRNQYVEALTERFQLQEKPELPFTKEEKRLHFLWPHVKHLFPNAPNGFELIALANESDIAKLNIVNCDTINILFKLIKCVQNSPFLYNGGDEKVYSENSYKFTWTRIGIQIERSGNWCFVMWNLLKRLYLNNHRIWCRNNPQVDDRLNKALSSLLPEQENIIDIASNNTDDEESEEVILVSETIPPQYNIEALGVDLNVFLNLIEEDPSSFLKNEWSNISRRLDIPVNNSILLWKYLKDQHNKNLQQEQEMKQQGIGHLFVKWKFYEEMTLVLSTKSKNNSKDDSSHQMLLNNSREFLRAVQEYPIIYERIFNHTTSTKEIYQACPETWNIIGGNIKVKGTTCAEFWKKIRFEYIETMTKEVPIFELGPGVDVQDVIKEMAFLYPVVLESIERSALTADTETTYTNPTDTAAAGLINICKENPQKALELLEEIKHYPILYDQIISKRRTQSITGIHNQESIWSFIAERIRLPVTQCIVLWFKLRKSYMTAKETNNKKPEQQQLVKLMAFMQSCLDSTIDWTDSITDMLIENVKLYPDLIYGNLPTTRKNVFWQKVAASVDRKVCECDKQWKLLKQIYDIRENCKKRCEGYLPPWQFSEKINFLREIQETTRKIPYGYKRQSIETLVDTIKKYPVLYDEELAYYFPEEKGTAWVSVSNETEFNGAEAQSLWELLKKSYFSFKKLNSNEYFASKFHMDMEFLQHAETTVTSNTGAKRESDELVDNFISTIHQDRRAKIVINAVKENPILYDDQHVDDFGHQTTETWIKIAQTLNLGVEEVKQLWESLKDEYIKFSKLPQNGQIKTIFEKDMEFLKPYICKAKSSTHLDNNTLVSLIEDSNDVTPIELIPRLHTNSKRSKECVGQESPKRCRLDQKTNINSPENDEIIIFDEISEVANNSNQEEIIEIDCDDNNEDEAVDEPPNIIQNIESNQICLENDLTQSNINDISKELSYQIINETDPRSNYDHFTITELQLNEQRFFSISEICEKSDRKT